MSYLDRTRFDKLDQTIITWMTHTGHHLERWALGVVFIWFGLLKVYGETSASSIIAKSVYWFDPTVVVPFLGWWECLMGMCMLIPSLRRVAVFLLLVRAPGTFLALVYHYQECFGDSIWTPTIQGQYLFKEITLIGAALVIGSTVKAPSRKLSDV